jgi:hypothetical protein
MMELIRGYGINGEQVIHALPVEADLWHAVDFQRTEGVCIYTRRALITRLADLIGAGHIYQLDIKDWREDIDRAGNVWYDHEYLAPNQYLPKLISP